MREKGRERERLRAPFESVATHTTQAFTAWACEFLLLCPVIVGPLPASSKSRMGAGASARRRKQFSAVQAALAAVRITAFFRGLCGVRLCLGVLIDRSFSMSGQFASIHSLLCCSLCSSCGASEGVGRG